MRCYVSDGEAARTCSRGCESSNCAGLRSRHSHCDCRSPTRRPYGPTRSPRLDFPDVIVEVFVSASPSVVKLAVCHPEDIGRLVLVQRRPSHGGPLCVTGHVRHSGGHRNGKGEKRDGRISRRMWLPLRVIGVASIISPARPSSCFSPRSSK